MVRALGYLWSSPCGLVGLLAAGLFWAFGWGRPRWGAGVMLIDAAGSPLGRWLAARGWAGFTLGWTVFCWVAPSPRLVAHERRHVQQCVALGPFFWPAYLLAHIVWGYVENPFERDARAAE